MHSWERRPYPLRTICTVIGLFAILSVAPLRAQETPTWAPTPDQLALLDNEVKTDGNPAFVLQPPKGYKFQPLKGGGGLVASGRWSSPTRQDGTTTEFLVLIGRRNPGQGPKAPEEFARNFFKPREADVGKMTFAPVEHGKIGDLPFARIRWASKHPTKNVDVYGFLYFASQGDLNIMIDSQDFGAHVAETLPIAEAAAQTFRIAPR